MTHDELVAGMAANLVQLGMDGVACAAALLARLAKMQGIPRGAVMAAFHNAWDMTEASQKQ